MDFRKVLPLIDRYFGWATPKRVLLLALATIVGIVSITLFEHRSTISAVFNKKDPTSEVKYVISDDTQRHLEDLVTRLDAVNLIMVQSANIRVNQRQVLFYYTDDRAVDAVIKGIISTDTLIQPIFTGDEKTNTQMVSMINGEFACYKNDMTTAGVIGPRITPFVVALCRISLPPYYGEFTGYITIGLKQFPDATLQNNLRIEAVRLSTEIFFKTFRGQ